MLRPGGTLRFYEHVRADARGWPAGRTGSSARGAGWPEGATPTATRWQPSPPPGCGWWSWTGSTSRPCRRWSPARPWGRGAAVVGRPDPRSSELGRVTAHGSHRRARARRILRKPAQACPTHRRGRRDDTAARQPADAHRRKPAHHHARHRTSRPERDGHDCPQFRDQQPGGCDREPAPLLARPVPSSTDRADTPDHHHRQAPTPAPTPRSPAPPWPARGRPPGDHRPSVRPPRRRSPPRHQPLKRSDCGLVAPPGGCELASSRPILARSTPRPDADPDRL